MGDLIPDEFHDLAFWMIEPCLEEHGNRKLYVCLHAWFILIVPAYNETCF